MEIKILEAKSFWKGPARIKESSSRKINGLVHQVQGDLTVDEFSSERTSYNNKTRCMQVREQLLEYFRSSNQNTNTNSAEADNDGARPWQLRLEIEIAQEQETNQDANATQSKRRKCFLRLNQLNKGGCLEGFHKITNGRAKFDATILAYIWGVREFGDGKSMVKKSLKIGKKGMAIGYGEEVLWAAEMAKSHWNLPSLNSRRLIVRVDELTVTIPWGTFGVYKQINQKLLSQAILSDVTIKFTETGACIPAHKAILASRSPVFFAMFQNDMKESRESILEITDMSEDSVRAFLEYLYYVDVRVPKRNGKVLFELFTAAHKYDIIALEEAMRELMVSKPFDDYDLESAIGLFQYARSVVPNDEKLKKKAVQLLRSYNTNLEDSLVYRELFVKDPEAAMELCRMGLEA